jgi:hypothetical protein
MDEKVSYPFKAISQVFERDCSHPRITLGQHHQALNELVLHEGVPLEVRELYETARNIALYSHYAYRLQQPAEMTAFAALEMALRIYAQSARPELFEKKTPPTLGKLARVALEGKWLTDERYPSRRARAERFARHKKFRSDVEYMESQGLKEMPATEPTEEDVQAAMSELAIAESFLETVTQHRNTLAHGSSMIMPSVFGTLGLVSESINQLFDCPEEAEK